MTLRRPRTCSGIYCHSSGQATPAYVAATPAWDAPGALRCDGCHANPPNYILPPVKARALVYQSESPHFRRVSPGQVTGV